MADRLIGDFDAAATPLLGTDLIGVSRDGVFTKKAPLSEVLGYTETLRDEIEALQLLIAADAAQVALDKTAAEDAATAAAASESGAEDQADIATTQAGIATTQAGTATIAAGTATTQAGIATAQATTATTQATAAAGAASTAATQAGIATTQAGIATTAATTAGGHATAADADRVAAEAAKVAAEVAADSAEDDRLAGETARDQAVAAAATAKRVSLFYNLDTAITDADPGPGRFRFNNATPSSVTKLFVDLLDASGGTATAWLDTFDDSTNTTNRGQISLIDSTDASIWAIYIVSDANETPSGYRKINVTHVASSGTWVNGRDVVLNFTRTGDKGADGLGAGNFNGPGVAVDGNAIVFDGTTGQLGKDAGFAPMPYDADIAAIAALTSASNKLPYYTGAGTAALADFTVAGRSMVAAADAAAQKVLLSVNNVDNTSDATKFAATATLTNKTLNLSGNTLTGTLAQFNTACSDADFASVAYVDGLVTGLWDDRGAFDASVNAFPSSGGSGTAGAIMKGDIWTISVAGTLPGSQAVGIGDTVRALVNSPGSTVGNWAISEGNLGYVPLNKDSNLSDLANAGTARTNLGLAIGTNVQAYDATLAAFAGLTIAANSLTIGTGADAFSQVTFAANKFPARGSTGDLVAKDISDLALGLLDDTTQAAMRTTLGLVPGTDVQAYSARLATIAGLSVASNDSFMQVKAGDWSSRTLSQVITDLQGDGTSSSSVGHRGIPLTDRSANYTLTAADNGKGTNHPAADTTARNITAFANMPPGYAHTIFNESGAGAISIVPDGSQTMYLAGTATTGTRTVASGGNATIVVTSSGRVMVSGAGVS